MKRIIYIAWIALFIILLQSCGTTRRYGTTIERDEKNPCMINMIIQIGVNGTDEDVAVVKRNLDACYNKECFIPCEDDSTKGCKTKLTVVVKNWAKLTDLEQSGFHKIDMIDDDGLPSNAYIGSPNSGASSGTWRRNAHPATYCHEVLHLCGLQDQYCSRLFDPVTGTITTELVCTEPPDPNGGNCCTPTANHTRCSSACSGHEHDLMATLSADLTCQNIMAVLKLAGYDNCPEACCKSESSFTNPASEVFVIPGYLHFGDQSTKFGTIGATVGYTNYVSPSIGLTIEGGYYINTEKDNNFKQTSGLLNVTAGINYLPGKKSGSKSPLSVSTHAQVGISNYSQKTSITGSNSVSNSNLSFHANVGAALNLNINKSWNIRLLQADYAPTFFFKTTQHNFRLSAGLVYKFKKQGKAALKKNR